MKFLNTSVQPRGRRVMVLYRYLKPLDTLPEHHGPLAESVSPSTIKEATEALMIASTANNTLRFDLRKNGDVVISEYVYTKIKNTRFLKG